MSNKAVITAVTNQKGGTGKTTTCENLGIGLAMEGKKVLLVDCDPQASLTIALGNPRPDDLPVTLSDLMAKVISDQPINSDRGKEMLEVIVVADRKRITKESFERWYASQTKYLKPEDQPEGVPRRHKSYADSLVKKKVRTNKGTKEVRYSDNPDYLTVDEAALQAKTSTARVYKWINAGRFPALRISKMVTRIPRKEFEAFLEENISRK